MLCVLVLVGVLLSHNRAARHVLERRHLAALGVQSRAWVAERPLTAPLAFVAVYIGCALFCLPVWWLQILAGHAFGLAGGVFWTLVASSAGSAVTVFVSQWAGGDWVAARAGGKAARFQRLAAQLGNHGFAVVVASRLLFVLPYGLGNYLVGLTGIKARDAALGTLVGNLPIVAVYVAIGARPSLIAEWQFWVGIGASVVVMLAGLTMARRMAVRAPAASGVTPPIAAISA